jgi:hypothetical protein
MLNFRKIAPRKKPHTRKAAPGIDSLENRLKPMKYILSFIAASLWIALSTGCVVTHETEPETTTTRTTTVNPPLLPPVSATTTTTTY